MVHATWRCTGPRCRWAGSIVTWKKTPLPPVSIWIDPYHQCRFPKRVDCWIIKVIDSPELFLCCFSASLHLQPIKGVLCLLYSFELCPLFRFKTPCKRNESVNSVSWEPRFNLRQGAMGQTFMGSAFSGIATLTINVWRVQMNWKTRFRFQILVSLNYEKGCDPKDFHGF